MLKTIGSRMSQVQSRPCSSLEMNRQRHGDSASYMERETEISEKIEKDTEKV
jgi:hypothetical protein